MSRINQPPWGLQALLGSKNFGDNPSELAETVVPTVDVFKFLSADRIDYELVNGATNARGDSIEIAVPEGELWLVMAIMGTSTPTRDGDQVSTQIELFEPPNTPTPASEFVLEFSGPAETIVSTGDYVGISYKPRGGPLPVWSGTKIRLRISSYLPVLIATITSVLSVQFVRLQI